MGVELHITRAAHWAENDDAPISSAEWLSYIESDSELSLTDVNGPHFAVWSGPSKYERPWLDWFQGNVHTKWPDTALFEKMLRIAESLGAKVQDDEGTDYVKPGDWDYDPTERMEAYARQSRRTWWQRLFRK